MAARTSWDAAALPDLIRAVAERKAYGLKAPRCDPSTDTSRGALWVWEARPQLLPKEVTAFSKAQRIMRKHVRPEFFCLPSSLDPLCVCVCVTGRLPCS